MSGKELLEVQNSIKETNDNLKRFAEEANKAAKQNSELSAEAKAQVDKLLAEQAVLNKRLADAEQMLAEGSHKNAARIPMTMGNEAINNEAFVNSLKGLNGSLKGTVNTTVKNSVTSMTSEAISSSTTAIQPHRAGLVDLPQQKLFLRDLINFHRTTSNAIDYVQVTGFNNKAGVVGENPSLGKPQSDLSYETKIAPIVTIAHFMHASKQVLNDFTALKSLIDSALVYGLKLREEEQLLLGSGQNGNLQGIMGVASAFKDQDITVSNYQALDQLRLALLQVQLAEYQADAIVLHPSDFTAINLLKNTLGNYIIGNPFGSFIPTLWGIPVVTSQSVDQGEFLTGAFRMGCNGWDREDINITVSTEDRDNFIKNMVTILCEERIGLTIERPEAFVAGEFGPLPSASAGSSTVAPSAAPSAAAPSAAPSAAAPSV